MGVAQILTRFSLGVLGHAASLLRPRRRYLEKVASAIGVVDPGLL